MRRPRRDVNGWLWFVALLALVASCLALLLVR